MKSRISNPEIDKLILLISKLPGFGPKSASRAALHLIKNKEQLMVPLAESLLSSSENIVTCEICGNIDVNSPCMICTDEGRSKNQICVVENIADQWSIENTRIFSGYFHILGGTISGSAPKNNELLINSLVERVKKQKIEEVIIATSATVEGQTTAFYIEDSLKNTKTKISKLAQGLPVGGEIENLDDGTLVSAFKNRKNLGQ